jgi:dTDP-4-amino-4,6-dideoxygalactose transaminase
VSSPAFFKIPIVDLHAQYSTLRDEVRQAIDDVNETQQFILGPAVDHFEAQMANYLQCRFSIGVASGSDALLLALMALGVGPGDAVITCRSLFSPRFLP